MYNIYRPICFYLIIYPPIHLSLNFYLSTEVKSERERGRDKDFGVSLVYTCIKLMLKSRIFITYIIYSHMCIYEYRQSFSYIPNPERWTNQTRDALNGGSWKSTGRDRYLLNVYIIFFCTYTYIYNAYVYACTNTHVPIRIQILCCIPF